MNTGSGKPESPRNAASLLERLTAQRNERQDRPPASIVEDLGSDPLMHTHWTYNEQPKEWLVLRSGAGFWTKDRWIGNSRDERIQLLTFGMRDHATFRYTAPEVGFEFATYQGLNKVFPDPYLNILFPFRLTPGGDHDRLRALWNDRNPKRTIEAGLGMWPRMRRDLLEKYDFRVWFESVNGDPAFE